MSRRRTSNPLSKSFQSEPLVTADQFADASTRSTEPPASTHDHSRNHNHNQKRKRDQKRERNRDRSTASGSTPAPATSARPHKKLRRSACPTPAQQQAQARARSASRRAAISRALQRLPHYDVPLAWHETRWEIAILLVLFLLVAVAVVDNFPATEAFNTAVATAIQSFRGGLDPLVIEFTSIGNPASMAAICLVMCLILLVARQRESLLFFAANVILAVLFIQALKFIFAIPRPTADPLIPLPQSYSFPSAHSFMSLIVFGLVGLVIFRALWRKGVPRNTAAIPGIILDVIAIFIGVSRVYVGVHWPTDVLAGWLLAALWLTFAGALYSLDQRK